MKKVPLVFMTLASLAVAYLHGDIPSAEGTKPIPKLAFVTYAADPGQERAAGMLNEMGPVDSYQSDMDYFLKKAGKIGIAFIGKFKQAASLKP